MVSAADHTNQPIFSEWVSPADWPWPIMVMVDEARRILSYFEHLPKSQQPPKSLWHSVYKCNKWIEEHSPLNDKPGGGMIQLSEDDIQR